MAGFRSSSSLSLSLSAASNPSTPLTPHFVHHADIGMGIGGGSGDMISPPPPTPGYFQSQFSPAQHSPWFNNTSPHTQNVGSMGPGGSLGGVGVGVGGGMRSPFASASSQVGRLQPIPATAPPSDDGHSSGEGPGAGAGAGAGSGLGLGLEGRQAEVGEGSRVPSDSVDTVDQGASGGASSSARRAGSHGLEGSSGSGASTEPGSSRSATGKAEGAEPTAEPSRTTSPGGGPTSSSKARRRGRKALTDKLKRRSKRVSAHGAQQPASRPGSGAYLDDERRWSQVRDGGEDGEGGSEGEETYGLEEQEADESDTGFEEGVGGGGGGASTHVREQWREDLGDTDRDDSDGDHNDGAATATATATTAEPSSRPTSTRHRAFTSPVHKLASASASTLDFGSQLGLQPGEPSSRPTSLVSVGTAGSPVGLGVGAGSGGGGGGGKRIVTPTSPILGPTSPAMPHVGPVSTATATGLFLSSGLGARRLGQGGTSERDGASPGPDGASITSQSRTATNSSTTPRLHLATLSSDDASQRAGPTPGPSDRGTDSSRSSEEDATTPAPHSRPTSALQRSESRTSGLGAGDEDDTFFDASDAGPMLSLSPSPIPIPRSGSGSDLVVSESVVSEEGGRSVVVPHEAARARSSTVVAPSAPRAAAAAAAAAAGEAPPLPASGSADSGLSVPSSTSTSTNASDHSSAGTGDDSLVGSFDESSSSARAGHNSGATEPSSEASRGSSSGGSGGTSGLQEQPKDVQAGTGTGEDVVLTHPASPTDDVFRGALLGGRAGDPVSTATLRQDASEQAKLEASPAAQGQAHASAPAQTQGHARVQGQGHGQAPAPIVSTVPAAYTLPTLIRTRTGSILPMARELPRTPPPLAPIQTGNVARAGGAPLVIESPATPNTPALAAFVGPMQISTAMPSPDLHMVEPQSFHLRAVPEPSAFQLDARGRPRGASVGALSGNHAPLRPSSLAASASSLAPLKQSPGPEERKMALWHEEAAGEQSGSSDAHRRSESYGTGAGDSSSHHHHHNNNIGGAGADLTQHGGGGGGGQSGGPGAGREHHSAISAGVSDRTTNTSHSRSVHSLAATDVSSSDTSLSAPEGEVDIEGGGGGGGGGGEESGKAVEVLRTPSSLLAHAGASQPAPLAASTAASADARTGASATSQSKERSLTFQHPEQERLPSTGAVEAGGLVSAMKNRARARSLGVASHSLSASSTLTGLSPASAAAGAGGGGPAGAMGAANPAVLAGVAAASASASASAQGATSSGGRSRSGSSASLQRQAQLPLRSPASFVLAVVGHRGAGKSTVIRKGLRQYGLSKPNLLSEKVSSYSTFCLVDNAERTIEVLEIDAAVLLNNPTKRFAWPKFLPSIDAVILCYDASEVSSFRSMSELLENFSVHGVRTVMLACKSDVEPKALNPYYASEMAAMYNVGLAECTSHTEEGRKRMRNCFSYLVKGVAKARAGRGVGSRTTASRQASQLTGTDSDAASPSTATAQQLRLSSGSTAEMGRARGNSVPNVRFSTNRSSGAAAVAESVYEEMNGDCPTARQDPHHTCSARCVSRKMSSATHESEPLSMSASEEEGSSDHRHRSMIHNAQLGLQSAKLAGGYLSLDELYDRFFYSAVSKIDPTFATTFMVFYRGFAQPIDLLMQAITRFEVLTHQEKFDEEVIRFSLIRMATMLREWVQDYPGDLSGSDTFPVLMNFYNRLLQHRDCADVVKAAEGSFAAVAGAVDLDAAWSARLNSHKPSSVAADHPPINMEGAPGSALAAPASMSALDQSGGSDGLLGLSIDPSFGNQGRSRADSGSIVASPASLVEPQTAAGSATETGRLTAQAVAGRDRSLSSATTASSDRQASVTSTDSATLVRASSISSSVPSKVTTLSYDSASAKAQLRAASDALFEIEDAKIAHELTVMAWSIFMNIKPRDLLRHALVPIDQRPDGPCMQEIRHFNYVSAWIVNMILAQSKLKNRSRLLEKFMNVAVLIRGENDYATLYCIIGALESQAVYRLGNTWHAIAEKPVLKQYQSLTKLMSPTKSYAAYRMAIQNSSGRTIPHLGVIYQDLVSLSAGNPSRTQVEGTVHWRMFELIDAHVSHFIACQQFSDSVGASDPALRKHIMDLPVSQVEDETLMERSKTLEPTARVRRTDEAWMSALSRKGKKLFASASLSQAT